MTTQELKDAGVNYENLVYPHGEMNILVQQFPSEELEEEDDEEGSTNNVVFPDIYIPRKNSVYSYGVTGETINLDDEEIRLDHIKHMRDSAERLKIMSLLLSKQADELEQTGKITTTLYYPEGSDWYELQKQQTKS
jgi:hypothetical protein